MDHLKRFTIQVRTRVLVSLVLGNLIIIAGLWVGLKVLRLNDLLLITLLIIFAFSWSLAFAYVIGNSVSRPIGLLWQAILHVSADHNSVPPPNLEKLKLGRELVTSLSMQVYQLATANSYIKGREPENNRSNVIIDSLPLPTIVFDSRQSIVFMNDSALKYLQRTEADVIGKNTLKIT